MTAARTGVMFTRYNITRTENQVRLSTQLHYPHNLFGGQGNSKRHWYSITLQHSVHHQALVVLEYIVKTGSERVGQQCKEQIYSLLTLQDFRFVDKDNKDHGQNG